jgi:trehalose 6-phosphate synthase
MKRGLRLSENKESEDDMAKRLVIVSNRLPVVIDKEPQGGWKARAGSGGLVTALAPVLRDRGGLWIGWTGITDVDTSDLTEALEATTEGAGFHMKPVPLSEVEMKKYYHGFANEIIWPLFHDLVPRCNFMPSYWNAYTEVNQRFARVVMESLTANDYVWVHDYHLMNVGRDLRDLGAKQDIGFFLHIPFPTLEVFLKLPWRTQILTALLQYDMIGFQTIGDRRNFVNCLEALFKDFEIEGNNTVQKMTIGDIEVKLGAFPISIDFREFADLASKPEVSRLADEIAGNQPDQEIILGIDRLDYTKGIPERLWAFRNALERYPELRERLTLVQVVVPSRRMIPEYESLKQEIEQLIGEINGQFTTSRWMPIRYMFRSLDRRLLAAYYRTARYGLVTPLKDGMNLIAKEFCACSIEEDSVLILSEFAGAAGQFQNYALMVNPHDIEGMADAIRRAWEMPEEEKKRRMAEMRKIVRTQDIFWWVDAFLQAAFAQRLDSFPHLHIREYMPRMEMDDGEPQ